MKLPTLFIYVPSYIKIFALKFSIGKLMQIHKFDLNLEVSLINFFWNFNLRDESEI